jgi:hypothetical protein
MLGVMLSCFNVQASEGESLPQDRVVPVEELPSIHNVVRHAESPGKTRIGDPQHLIRWTTAYSTDETYYEDWIHDRDTVPGQGSPLEYFIQGYNSFDPKYDGMVWTIDNPPPGANFWLGDVGSHYWSAIVIQAEYNDQDQLLWYPDFANTIPGWTSDKNLIRLINLGNVGHFWVSCNPNYEVEFSPGGIAGPSENETKAQFPNPRAWIAGWFQSREEYIRGMREIIETNWGDITEYLDKLKAVFPSFPHDLEPGGENEDVAMGTKIQWALKRLYGIGLDWKTLLDPNGNVITEQEIPMMDVDQPELNSGDLLALRKFIAGLRYAWLVPLDSSGSPVDSWNGTPLDDGSTWEWSADGLMAARLWKRGLLSVWNSAPALLHSVIPHGELSLEEEAIAPVLNSTNLELILSAISKNSDAANILGILRNRWNALISRAGNSLPPPLIRSDLTGDALDALSDHIDSLQQKAVQLDDARRAWITMRDKTPLPRDLAVSELSSNSILALGDYVANGNYGEDYDGAWPELKSVLPEPIQNGMSSGVTAKGLGTLKKYLVDIQEELTTVISEKERDKSYFIGTCLMGAGIALGMWGTSIVQQWFDHKPAVRGSGFAQLSNRYSVWRIRRI